MTEPDELQRVREIAFALPEVTERISHGSPSFFIREKRTLCSFHNGHHGDERVSLWVPAPPGVQEELVALEPERFYRPPYVGPSGWIGIVLTVEPDWDEVASIIEDAYRHVAQKTLVKLLDERD